MTTSEIRYWLSSNFTCGLDRWSVWCLYVSSSSRGCAVAQYAVLEANGYSQWDIGQISHITVQDGGRPPFWKKNMKSPSNSGFCCRINHSYYSLYYCRDMVISNLVTMEDCDSECRSQPEPVFTLLTTISQPLKPKDLFLNYLKTVHGLTLLIESVKNWTVNISLTQISTTGTESFTHKMAALEFCQ